MKNINISLPVAELNKVLAALERMPYVEVVALIQEIMKQANAQVAPQSAPQDAPLDVVDKALASDA